MTLAGLLFGVVLSAADRPGEWTGNYPPCTQYREVLKGSHLNLGVRLNSSVPDVNAAFVRAMDFWATVLDMNWHEEDSINCSLQIVDGHDGLFKPAEVARSQFPGRPGFQGWIAFNPKAVLTPNEIYSLAVHELGHVLGLLHNPSARSVMYYLSLDGLLLLDAADLTALSTHHKLRVMPGQHEIVVAPRPTPASDVLSGSGLKN